MLVMLGKIALVLLILVVLKAIISPGKGDEGVGEKPKTPRPEGPGAG